jgi:hypothetical protein
LPSPPSPPRTPPLPSSSLTVQVIAATIIFDAGESITLLMPVNSAVWTLSSVPHILVCNVSRCPWLSQYGAQLVSEHVVVTATPAAQPDATLLSDGNQHRSFRLLMGVKAALSVTLKRPVGYGFTASRAHCRLQLLGFECT